MITSLFKSTGLKRNRSRIAPTKRPPKSRSTITASVEPQSNYNGQQSNPIQQLGSVDPLCEWDICVRDIVKHFGEVGAANGVSFDLLEGQLMALLGPSGCGKTTTLRLLAGFEHLDSGTIEMHGEVMAAPGIHVPPEKRSIGMVFQEYALFPHMNVAENVRFGLHAYNKNKEHRVQEVLEMVGLSRLEKRMPHELSGGQQQRVALARALAPEPHLILLDEPFSNLDASLRTRVRSDVRSILKQAEATAIFVTHDQEEALSLVDQVTVLMNGKVQQIATPQMLYYRPATPEVASFVGEANFLPGFAHGKTVECAFGTLSTITPMTGAVEVMIRPENILVSPSESETGCYITDVIFYGHDQLLKIQHNNYLLQSRIVGTQDQVVCGQQVSMEINEPVMAYA